LNEILQLRSADSFFPFFPCFASFDFFSSQCTCTFSPLQNKQKKSFSTFAHEQHIAAPSFAPSETSIEPRTRKHRRIKIRKKLTHGSALNGRRADHSRRRSCAHCSPHRNGSLRIRHEALSIQFLSRPDDGISEAASTAYGRRGEIPLDDDEEIDSGSDFDDNDEARSAPPQAEAARSSSSGAILSNRQTNATTGTAGGGGLEGVYEGAVQASAALAPHLTAPIVLRSMGYHAGLLLAERMLHREAFLRYTPLDITRFISGTLWRLLFNKKVDKTRHLDNVYFTITDLNFRWMRCTGGVGPSAAAAGTAASSLPVSSTGGSAASTAATAPLFNQHLPPHLQVAPGFAHDGNLLDASASAREAAAAREKALSGQPEQRDMLAYMQGVLSVVIEAIMGPHHRALVTYSVVAAGAGDGIDAAMFTLDFRQSPKI
jgi:hypothetical protein